MNRQFKAGLVSFVTVTLVVVVPVFAQIPDGVSPGAADRMALIAGRCPTFIWDSVPGAAFHELVGYRLPDDSDMADPAAIDLADTDQVLYAKVSGSAPAWEPELAECLAPGGSYVWFVRAVFREEEGEVVEASEWSYGKYFSISSMPSAREVEEALRVLRRHSSYQVESEALSAEKADTFPAARSRQIDVPQLAPKSVTTAKAAIKGTVPDATGETYGVVGISNSPNGAGVAAANTNGGPDLVLDGSADFFPDTKLSESGIDRPWGTPQTFNIQNSVGAGMALQVDGDEVLTTASPLDADTLDGIDGADFATDVEAEGLVTAHAASGDHDGRYFTETELSASGAGGQVHWANLVSVPSGLNDGDDDTVFSVSGCVKVYSSNLALDNYYTSISVTCPANTYAVSGGYSNGSWNAAKQCIPIVSYPSSSTTWYVTWAAPDTTECAGNYSRTYALCCP